MVGGGEGWGHLNWNKNFKKEGGGELGGAYQGGLFHQRFYLHSSGLGGGGEGGDI